MRACVLAEEKERGEREGEQERRRSGEERRKEKGHTDTQEEEMHSQAHA